MNDHIVAVERTVAELLGTMGFDDFRVSVEPGTRPDPWRLMVSMREGRFLIGRGGENLRAFEHLTRLLIARRMGESAPAVMCDVNNYRHERAEYLRAVARSVAQRVKREGRPIGLRPMGAFERRIVHLELSTRPDVTTESEGEGAERRIIVKPYGTAAV
ncbi:hypothetical protein HYW67_01030 [Candidatus Parcubacteria bacterium]|nr:hypothetical protein [Candidatus Parcubacteria bacterium]